MNEDMLWDHQKRALNQMHNGCVLKGKVGSGKSLTAVAYFNRVHRGDVRHIYIITTAKKRNSGEWWTDLERGGVTPDDDEADVTIDSWNNIKKYLDVKGAFFIFDEQKASGSGKWGYSFVRIARNNFWVMLSATPGDVWMDYWSLFVANGLYRTRTEFIDQHVEFDRFAKYPRVKRYHGVRKLEGYRDRISVDMEDMRTTVRHRKWIPCEWDRERYLEMTRRRWDPYKDEPVTDAGALCYVQRRIVNEDPSRCEAIRQIWKEHPRLIIFYSFDYERELLLDLARGFGCEVAEYNGHRHQPTPEGDAWVYLVNYNSGAEGWNCITTDTMVFYSPSYSWQLMEQCEGRIDRMSTPFHDLWYYVLHSSSGIDRSIKEALSYKRAFNEKRYVKGLERG